VLCPALDTKIVVGTATRGQQLELLRPHSPFLTTEQAPQKLTPEITSQSNRSLPAQLPLATTAVAVAPNNMYGTTCKPTQSSRLPTTPTPLVQRELPAHAVVLLSVEVEPPSPRLSTTPDLPPHTSWLDILMFPLLKLTKPPSPHL
jgi:hypothetical protein